MLPFLKFILLSSCQGGLAAMPPASLCLLEILPFDPSGVVLGGLVAGAFLGQFHGRELLNYDPSD